MSKTEVIATGYAHLLSLDKAVAHCRAERIGDVAARAGFERLHRWYVDDFRPLLLEKQFDGSRLSELDQEFERVVECSSGRTRTSAGKSVLKKVRTALKAPTEHVGRNDQAVATDREKALIVELGKILPSAASGYDQALRDLADTDRLSFRGVASELREVLRDVLDFYAPDAQLPASGDGRKPTMKSKVKHILKHRGVGDTRRGTAEAAAEIFDAGVPNLARSVYDLGSLDTHTSPTRTEVLRLRAYLTALLHDLVEIPH